MSRRVARWTVASSSNELANATIYPTLSNWQTDMTSQPTITSLLNSLHTHLQTQTQLLPTLHAQLGLPPTALADELSSLQKALTRCVEDQISSRMKQVHELEERCENLESECHSYSVALGPSAKGLEITATELRREPVLPRRCDQLAELQEKLRQVSCSCWYHDAG